MGESVYIYVVKLTRGQRGSCFSSFFSIKAHLLLDLLL
jgi:hypothetical protein